MLGFSRVELCENAVCIIRMIRLIEIMKRSSFCCSPQSLTGITFIPLRGKCPFPAVCRQNLRLDISAQKSHIFYIVLTSASVIRVMGKVGSAAREQPSAQLHGVGVGVLFSSCEILS
jgi:hypothetical protein